MTRLYHQLLLLFAGATQKELARQLRYLKVENEILRQKLPSRLTVTMTERERLLKFGLPLGGAIRKLISIVHPETFLRWAREDRRRKPHQEPVRRGRRRTPESIRRLVLKLARENDWGYTRILGELKKLGITSVFRNTVKRIMREQGLDPGPLRGPGTWDDFLKRNAASLWQCDFFSRRVMTLKGMRELFVLVFLHAETRRVYVSPSTFHPNDAWVCKQTKAIVRKARRGGLRVGKVFHDNDGKFRGQFRQTLKSLRATPRRCAYRSPNTRALVERFIQSIQQECLDHFIIFGEPHMDYLVREYIEHYHKERPHQGLGNVQLGRRRKGKRNKSPSREGEHEPRGAIQCRQRLSGLLKHYYREAA